MKPDSSIAGVILCGGRSRRMGGVAKAHCNLGGQPLLHHVIDRVSSQVDRLLLSVETISDEYRDYGLEQVADPVRGHTGPLGGLLSALRQMAEEQTWLLMVPCDAPFVPRDLGSRLVQTAQDSGSAGCVVSYFGQLQPTFSVWHQSLLAGLTRAVMEENMAGFKQYLDDHPLPILEWQSSDALPFFNINDPESLKEAERYLSVMSFSK